MSNHKIPRKNPYLTTYVKIVTKNVVGIENTFETEIPACDDIAKIIVGSITSEKLSLSYSTFNSKIGSDYNVTIITDIDNNIKYNDTGLPPVIKSEKYPTGDYYIYYIPICSENNNSDPSTYNVGTACSRYKIHIDWESKTVTSPTEPIDSESVVFPEVSFETMNPEINAGERTVKSTADYSNATKNLKYMIYYYCKDDYFNGADYYNMDIPFDLEDNYAVFHARLDTSFEAESGYKYKTEIRAFDSAGNFIKKKELDYEIDATYDNVSPNLFATIEEESFNNISLTIGSMTNDSGSGIKKNADDKIIITQYVKKITSTEDKVYIPASSVETISENDLKKINQDDVYQLTANAGETIKLPFDYFDYGIYSVIVKVEDNNGNYSLNQTSVEHNYVKDFKLQKNSTDSNQIEIIKSTIDSDGTIKKIINNDELVLADQTTDYDFLSSNYLNLSFKSEEAKEKYIMLFNLPIDWKDTQRYFNIYIYPKFYFDDETLKRKMIYQYENEYQILADYPALVQLVQTDATLSTTAEDWDMRGETIEYKQVDGDYLYTVDLSKITKKYYAVIVHFADGTSKMISEKR